MPTGKYPRTAEWKEKHKESMSSRHKGKIRSPEWRKSMSEGQRKGFLLTCTECNKEIYRSQYRSNLKYQFCNHICQASWQSKYMKRENSPAWEGGITPLNESIRALDEMRVWKKLVLIRDGFKCRECNNATHDLHIHHKKPFFILLKCFLALYDQFSPIDDKETLIRLAVKYTEFWDINNGIALCFDCHRKQPNHYKWLRKKK